MATYTKTSPYSNTKITASGELDILKIRPVPADDDDFLYEVEPQYNFRPDLLSYDLYGTPKLWWVFAQRNLDILKDPVFDFKAGVKIFLPKQSALQKALGI